MPRNGNYRRGRFTTGENGRLVRYEYGFVTQLIRTLEKFAKL